eukprot:TRINITY_DN11546_c0_g2_i1.p1 TRINITY_DN11546_c0_g2~~TRINITY_DN11546_c0_g2_i1.p1  ORF type:complete len:781 (+),score=275.84 TRINITY_DN11546_c0_g2_i1:138-2480(+)
MDRMLGELVRRSRPTTPLLLRSTLPATQAVVEALEPFAEAGLAPLVHCELADADDAAQVATADRVAAGMERGEWVYLANVRPDHAQLLRRVALALFVAAPSSVRPTFRLLLSTLTEYTEFEPPPSWTQTALPLVLLHLCNSPSSLLGDMDTMKVVPRHTPDITRYDADAFATAMADTAERLTQNDESLKSLSFDEHARLCGVTDGMEFFRMLPDAIRLNHVLTELDLTGSLIADAGAAQMGGVLKANRSLRHLCLSRNLVSNDGVAALCQGLSWNPSLRRLDLSHNPGMGDPALQSIAAVLPGETQRLEELCLAGNNAFSHPEKRWSRAALRELWRGMASSKLLKLDMRSCGLSGCHVAALSAECLSKNPPLQVLDLSENQIGDHGAVFISRELKHMRNTHLAEVWLDDCALGLAALVAWGAALKHASCLGLLSLMHALPCRAAQRTTVTVDEEEAKEPTPVPEEECDEPIITASGKEERLDGLRLLGAGLKENSGLHTLRLGHCQLPDEGLLMLCDGLTAARKKGICALTSWDLTANYTLTDRGAQVLKAYLQGHDTDGKGCSLRSIQLSHSDIDVAERAVLSLDRSLIEDLTLVGVGFTDGVAMAFRDAIVSSKTTRLRRLDLSCNPIHREGWQRVGEVLQVHPTLEEVLLRATLCTAHQEAAGAGLALDREGRPKGLPWYKDWGVSVVRPFCKILAGLRAGKNPLRRLDLRENTLPDPCIEVIAAALRETDLPLEVDLRANLATAAVLPVLDAVQLREGLRIAVDVPGTAPQPAAEP